MVPCLSFSLAFFCGFPKLVDFETPVKVLNPLCSSPLCFLKPVSECFSISMTPRRICSAFRSTLHSLQSFSCTSVLFNTYAHAAYASLPNAPSPVADPGGGGAGTRAPPCRQKKKKEEEEKEKNRPWDSSSQTPQHDV